MGYEISCLQRAEAFQFEVAEGQCENSLRLQLSRESPRSDMIRLSPLLFVEEKRQLRSDSRDCSSACSKGETQEEI